MHSMTIGLVIGFVGSLTISWHFYRLGRAANPS